MKEITKTVYVCDYCGYEDTRKDFVEFHERCCALNPVNQPCSVCSNMILGVGCCKNMDINVVGGNVLCFYYSEGTPQNPFESFLELQKNITGDNNNNE